ncbi:hypothetical protein PTTG_06277 [Puccinia triticina 1-1 BBBD Race 1]|uniref:Amine oxidase domain-containing protein n=2 Tax=Puccinia triticina TaxID=208348 RepID=A0A0C4EZL8_PUCT1|nr:uncharacterized protein PtA15_7A606 [Puccinia triticina]OAV95605.1 hypothetical protein PTTG_06277 [Puccinia triticina 1-1 BBBD Race 1]WAQ86877.1 hypothetical protein PtA15_7A606 [Puccinia triticina]WAR56745.1 hypothetical protein PtB15_7B595 [Puccinia triticina]
MKVAVVGGGISGLTAVWLLNEYSDHDVDLFEANEYVGGHTNTVTYKDTPVDTGFIVFNKLTYPNFVKFLEVLNVDYIASNMSFSVKRAFAPAYEWSGNGIFSLFSGISSWADRFGQVRLIWDLVRFNHLAVDVLFGPEGELSIEEYLLKHGYSDSFKRNYLLPIISSIWSTPANKTAMHFPTRTLIRFMSNHHLLQVFNQPQWLTIKNGSKTYVDKILSKLDPKNCFTSTPIESISMDQSSKKVSLKASNSPTLHGPYDQVIFASHADQTVKILKNSQCSDVLSAEIDVLSRFEFNQNEAVLHNDVSLMPRNRDTWTSWNYLITDPCQNQPPTKPHTQEKASDVSCVENTVCLTYWMNLLQSIPEKSCGPVLVTLNPQEEINPNCVFGRWKYDHPLYTSDSVKAQEDIGGIQTKNGLSFVGAWTNYGFHEDGLTSSLRLLLLQQPALFAVRSPFEKVSVTEEAVRPVGRMTRFLFGFVQLCIQIICYFVWPIVRTIFIRTPVKSKLA